MPHTSHAPRYNDDVVEYADMLLQHFSAQISANYLKFIKTRIVPELGEFSDVPVRELRTIMTIGYFANPITGSRISHILDYDPATVSRSTRWLLEQGYVVSQENPKDARSIVYGLTQRGIDLAVVYRDVSRQSIAEINREDPKQPSRKEILNALSVLECVRDRSVYAAQLGKAFKRNRKREA